MDDEEQKIDRILNVGSQAMVRHYTLFVPPKEAKSGSEYFWVKSTDLKNMHALISVSGVAVTQ